MDAATAAIAIDWGTSNFRAYRLAADGGALEERKAAAGIATVPPQGFPNVLDREIGDWLQAEPQAPVIMAGMVGSRNGWVEAPYAPLPAGPADLKARLTRIRRADRGEALIIDGIGDVIRGEETLALGSGVSNGVILSPGTHPKWIEMKDRRIHRFQTFMTGEFFAVLCEHSLLGRLMEQGGEADDEAGFQRGLELSAHPGGLTRAAFATRSDVLLGRMKPTEARSFLSGLLIGQEIAGAKASFGLPHSLTLIAEGAKARSYETALLRHGVKTVRADSDILLLAGLKAILQA
jgi:2-dehydro-3-deoxygalactonokinase